MARNAASSPPTATTRDTPASTSTAATRLAIGWPSTTRSALSCPIRELRPPVRTAPRMSPTTDPDEIGLVLGVEVAWRAPGEEVGDEAGLDRPVHDRSAVA